MVKKYCINIFFYRSCESSPRFPMNNGNKKVQMRGGGTGTEATKWPPTLQRKALLRGTWGLLRIPSHFTDH